MQEWLVMFCCMMFISVWASWTVWSVADVSRLRWRSRARHDRVPIASTRTRRPASFEVRHAKGNTSPRLSEMRHAMGYAIQNEKCVVRKNLLHRKSRRVSPSRSTRARAPSAPSPPSTGACQSSPETVTVPLRNQTVIALHPVQVHLGKCKYRGEAVQPTGWGRLFVERVVISDSLEAELVGQVVRVVQDTDAVGVRLALEELNPVTGKSRS